MGTEYYIVKPDKKELYYLGKHIVLSEFKNIAYGKVEAEFPPYNYYEELANAMLEVNYFPDLYVEQVWDIAYDILEWCDSPVYIDNDCSYNFLNVKNYKETGSILNVYKKFKDKYSNIFMLEEQLDNLLELIPTNYYIYNENKMILPIPTIEKYIKESKNDKG